MGARAVPAGDGKHSGSTRPWHPAPVLPQPASYSAERPNPFRKLAFRSGLIMLFTQMGVLSELIQTALHFNAYLLYLVAPPAFLGTLFTGGIKRTMGNKAAWFWLGFVACMAFSIPGSTWAGGSVGRFQSYLEFSFPFLFVVGGLTIEWKEVRSIYSCMSAAGLLVIAAAGIFAREDGGRIDLASASGSIGNANDLASHLVLMLPFLLFLALDQRRAPVIRWGMILPALYAIKVLLGTASRGGLIALCAIFLLILVRGSGRQRMATLGIIVVLVISVPLLLRGNAADRLGSLFGSEHEEALESKDARSYLLKQSLIYTMQHPAFGVGMGQFSNYEGKMAGLEGRFGNWHETHNAFTEVSSECGIPAVIFFILGIGSAFISVNSVYGKARREGHTDIANTCLCFLLAFAGYVVSVTFLANAYRFYLPALIGLSIATTAAARNEMAMRNQNQLANQPPMPSPYPNRPRPRPSR